MLIFPSLSIHYNCTGKTTVLSKWQFIYHRSRVDWPDFTGKTTVLSKWQFIYHRSRVDWPDCTGKTIVLSKRQFIYHRSKVDWTDCTGKTLCYIYTVQHGFWYDFRCMAKANCQNRCVVKIRAVNLAVYHYSPTHVQSTQCETETLWRERYRNWMVRWEGKII